MVHLGLGNFFRAHQAWYTDLAPDADEWGIAAFTGRSATTANVLREQQGVYTLVTLAESGSVAQPIGSISAAHAAADHAAWLGHLSDPDVAVLTLTITEAGYRGGADGAPGRLVAGLRARRDAGAGGLSVVPCDNLPDNGAVTRDIVTALAAEVDPGLADWITDHVEFVSTMVDRITPATTDADRLLVRDLTGLEDRSPVTTEPFSEWVLAGRFAAGRPAWEDVGARFVDDVEPYERRKLWFLNGAHSLLAYAGLLRGHETIADAIADPTLRGWVEQWWDEAARHVGQDAGAVADYRSALLGRFANPAVRHRLSQVAMDGSQKLPVRILPVVRAERAAGRVPAGAARVLAAWTAHLRRGEQVADAGLDLPGLAADPLEVAVTRVLRRLGDDLGDDRPLVGAVTADANDRSW